MRDFKQSIIFTSIEDPLPVNLLQISFIKIRTTLKRKSLQEG